MTIQIGKVIAVRGTEIIVAVDEHANIDTVFYDGVTYNGVSIRELIVIRRGFFDIVCVIEGEYLEESYSQKKMRGNPHERIHQTLQDPSTSLNLQRRIQVKPIGHFLGDDFTQGLKYMPMIYDQAYLMSSHRVTAVFGRHTDESFVIGRLLKEELKVSLPWQTLFNSHIGIFGNTGSGKSNTLAKIYTTLFDSRAKGMQNKSSFVILDFNGEYTGDQLLSERMKKNIRLSTRNGESSSKWLMSADEFWDTEVLSILFQATKATQRPFIQRVVNGEIKYRVKTGAHIAYLKKAVEVCFGGTSTNSATKSLLESAFRLLPRNTSTTEFKSPFEGLVWHNTSKTYYFSKDQIFPSDREFGRRLDSRVEEFFNSTHGQIDPFNKFLLLSYVRLAFEITSGHVQVDHVHPMIKRAEASIQSLRKVLKVDGQSEVNSDDKIVQVISLRDCDTDTKKLLPIVIAKSLYDDHRSRVASPVDQTCHLIIDEAHNILSSSSNSEHETWRDYRLELFEEIIKEGRKFGFYLTISSQRPADISPTIISQVHNYFIHRLVNERDLKLLESSVSSLDAFSRAAIPNLSKGSCVVTGTSFDMPMLIQVDVMERQKQPDSHDVDLESLWSSSSGKGN